MKNVIFGLLAGLCISLLVSCSLLGGGPSQALIDQNKAQLVDLQTKVDAARTTSQQAFDRAIQANDAIAAAVAQKQLEDTKKDQKVLDQAKVVNTGLQTTHDAAAGNADAFSQGLSSLGGLLPPPFGTILTLAGTLGFGLYKNYRTNQDAKAALDAQAALANHALATDTTASDIAIHTSTVLSGLTPGAKALYNNTPDINTPKGVV